MDKCIEGIIGFLKKTREEICPFRKERGGTINYSQYHISIAVAARLV